MNEVREDVLSGQTPNSPSAPVAQELQDRLLPSSAPNPALMRRLREYLLESGAPNVRLRPQWLANKLNVDERELLGALAYGVRDGLVEMHWEVFCPMCGGGSGDIGSLSLARENIECVGCQASFDLYLDRDVRVTFSASERLRRERGDEEVPLTADGDAELATRGLDLLLVPAFWELFSGEAPAADESLRIGRVTILFTDLRGSTAMVHAGACLAVKLNDRLDFFGGAVNTAARVQGLSRGNDVVVTDEVIADIETEGNEGKRQFHTEERFDARLRGLTEPVRVHRLVAAKAGEVVAPGLNGSVTARFLRLIKRK